MAVTKNDYCNNLFYLFRIYFTRAITAKTTNTTSNKHGAEIIYSGNPNLIGIVLSFHLLVINERVKLAILPSLGTVSTWATGQHYEPAAVNTFLQIADYYLVAHALAHGHTVVTHEKASPSTKKIKIPDACIGLGIKCMTPFEILRLERARFVLGQ